MLCVGQKDVGVPLPKKSFTDRRVQVRPAHGAEHVGEREKGKASHQADAHGVAGGAHDCLFGEVMWLQGISTHYQEESRLRKSR